ncbi:hypothetical protein RHSIM_RhsimUnG0202700 [Rhododendron simsii]|uniref:Uncharacterized protein n=1 Tax=Rhododendron simsii TaxID=118357 RepID=A0A834L414_RHOSS|nr:hypothetical protein RHSIM_RhsimUnG0202700 [Rhododendron simsii]
MVMVFGCGDPVGVGRAGGVDGLGKGNINFNCAKYAKKYTPIWNKIDARWTPQLHRPLHAVGSYLNLQLRYRDNFFNVAEIKQGLHACMDRMLSYEERLRPDIQLNYIL